MTMLATLNYYSRLLFDPLFLTRHRLNQSLAEMIKPLAKRVGECLDVGCGDRPYEYLFDKGSYLGVDVENSGRPLDMKLPDQYYDGKTLPYNEGRFDLVMSTQVLEHVPNPMSLVSEMARVCKNGGDVILSIPFVYPEHELPFDYFRYTAFGIREILKQAGLEVVEIRKDSSWIEVLAVLLNVYVINNLVIPLRGFGRLYTLFICFPVQFLALILGFLLPDDGTLYLNVVVRARKI